MKTNIIVTFCAALLLSAAALTSCVGTPPAQQATPGVAAAPALELSTFEGKDWKLLELRRAAETVRLDRLSLAQLGMEDAFTVNFEDGRISGMGAPNRFFGPYTPGDDNNLSIGLLASTLMMALFEPEELREHEYFSYLSNVSRWYIREGRLELYSHGEGDETVLVFILK